MTFYERLSACLLVFCLLGGSSGQALADSEDDGPKQWEELELQLPAPPRQEDLLPFYVSAATDNRFFIDPLSISVGGDGVVRYTLVVLTGGGVANVSFEGMRCETKERRLYAFGRPDGVWSKARGGKWERVREAVNNRHHAALFQEYFCPDGIAVLSSDEARKLLRRGGYTRPMRW